MTQVIPSIDDTYLHLLFGRDGPELCDIDHLNPVGCSLSSLELTSQRALGYFIEMIEREYVKREICVSDIVLYKTK
jgi:hypothetical protein